MTRKQLAMVFFAALCSNIIGCRFGYAIAHRELFLVLILGTLLPIMQAINSAFFIAAQNRKQRIQIATAAGLATASAGAVVTLFLTAEPT